MPGNIGSWNEWARHIIEELKRFDIEIDKIKEDLFTIDKRLVKVETELKLKSGIWGLLGGVIPAAILLIVYVVKEKLFK